MRAHGCEAKNYGMSQQLEQVGGKWRKRGKQINFAQHIMRHFVVRVSGLGEGEERDNVVLYSKQLRRNCKIKKLRAKPDQCCSGQRSGSKKKKKRKKSEKVSTRSLEVFRIQDLKSAYIRKRR